MAGPPDTPVIVFQGRLVATKGLRLLLEAARVLRDRDYVFHILVIGDGPERIALETFARNAGLTDRVQFAGCLDHDELEAALSRAYVVVAPSLGGEVFGLVVAENMRRGLPVIASDLGSFVEVLGEGGLTFHAGEASDLVAKLGQLLNNPALASKMGGLALQRIQDHYSEERMFQDHLSLYRGLLTSL